jgi:hypothetical protein
LLVTAVGLDGAATVTTVVAHIGSVTHVTLVSVPDTVVTGTITAGEQAVTTGDLEGFTTLVVQTTGFGSATLRIEGNADGTNWIQQNFTNTFNGLVVNQITTNSIFSMNISAFKQMRVRASAYSSGTITVRMVLSRSTTTQPSNVIVQDLQYVATNAIDVNSGNVGSGTQRVVLATNQSTTGWNVTTNQLGGAWNVSSSHVVALGGHIGTVLHVGSTGNLVCHSKAGFSSSGDFKVFHANTAFPRINICSIVIVVSAAANVSVIEGTGATCGTNPISILGSTSAAGANGMALAANGGFSSIASTPWIGTTTAENDVCILSSAGRISGTVTYRGF